MDPKLDCLIFLFGLITNSNRLKTEHKDHLKYQSVENLKIHRLIYMVFFGLESGFGQCLYLFFYQGCSLSQCVSNVHYCLEWSNHSSSSSSVKMQNHSTRQCVYKIDIEAMLFSLKNPFLSLSRFRRMIRCLKINEGPDFLTNGKRYFSKACMLSLTIIVTWLCQNM